MERRFNITQSKIKDVDLTLKRRPAPLELINSSVVMPFISHDRNTQLN